MTAVPPSIRRFRIVYGVVVLLTALNAALVWPRFAAVLGRYPELGLGSRLVVFGTMAVGVAIPALIWWLIGWRRSGMARWVLALIVAIAAVYLGLALRSGQGLTSMLLVSVAALLLQISALWLLFRPDARPWFTRPLVEPAT